MSALCSYEHARISNNKVMGLVVLGVVQSTEEGFAIDWGHIVECLNKVRGWGTWVILCLYQSRGGARLARFYNICHYKQW